MKMDALQQWLYETAGQLKTCSPGPRDLIIARLAELAGVAADYGGVRPHDGSVVAAQGAAWVTEATCLAALLAHMDSVR